MNAWHATYGPQGLVIIGVSQQTSLGPLGDTVAEDRAVSLLRAHRGALDRLAALLQEQETLDGTVVREVLAEEGGGGPVLDLPARTRA